MELRLYILEENISKVKSIIIKKFKEENKEKNKITRVLPICETN